MVLSEGVCVFQGLRPTQAVQGPVGGPDKELVGRAQGNDEVSTSTNISRSQLKPVSCVAAGLAYVPCPCLLLYLLAFFSHVKIWHQAPCPQFYVCCNNSFNPFIKVSGTLAHAECHRDLKNGCRTCI